MTDLFSKERLEKIASWREIYGADSNVMIPAAEAEELARRELQRREAAEKPVAWRWFDGRGYNSTTDKIQADALAKDGVVVEPLGPLQALPVVIDNILSAAKQIVREFEEAERNRGEPFKDNYTDPMTRKVEINHIMVSIPKIRNLAAAMLQAGNYPAIPEGWVLAPREIHLDASDIESICSQCGDGGGTYGDFTGGILWIGEVDNDGEKVYGLHISSGEYPEEGCSTLSEFAATPRPPADDLASLISQKRIAVTPEYEGQWHADVYGEEATPIQHGEGKTPIEAVRAALSAPQPGKGE